MSLYGRVFAAMYDRMLAATEEAGLRDRRRALLAEARGRVLELGAGTGINVGLYPAAGIEEVVFTEPEEPMARRLSARVADRGAGAAMQVVHAPAERLPFPDASFDTVVATLVLCTVGDLQASIAEARRVLKPGGRLLFLEHVRSEDAGQARWQDRLHGPWKAVGHGCNTNRSTLDAIRAGAFDVERVDHDRVPKAPPIVRPMIVGVAVAA
jgi:ubiquinone/menaquinone biosynthesis C-methylase UbiE